MKTMTCRQLEGACDQKFLAETFEEMADASKKHAMEMADRGDRAHIDKMKEMGNLMNDPAAMRECFQRMRDAFDDLPSS